MQFKQKLMSLNYSTCDKCSQKDDLIEKYLKLIKLLKAKCQKSAKNFVKNNVIQSDTLYEYSCDKSKSQQFSQPIKSELNPQKTAIKQTTTNHQLLNLAVIVISNKCRKALLNYSLNKIKQSLEHNIQPTPSFNPPSFNLQGSLSSIIRQTLSYGKNMQQKINTQQIEFKKQFLSKTFHLQLQNQSYLNKIHFLHKQIQQSQKRFFKETQKKRESLETVAEQMREKTQQVIQLQQLIKRYQRDLGKSLKSMMTETVLVQDIEEIKKTCYRLENINEKLNDDLRNINLTVQQLNIQINRLNQENQRLRNDIRLLKEKNFQLSTNVEHNANLQQSYKTILKRLEKKIIAVKRKQKQLLHHYQSIKSGKQHFNNQQQSKLVSTKNTDLSVQQQQQQIHLEKEKRFTLRRELENDQKIEQVFTFLFNIKTENYSMKNVHLFDEEELQLLMSHKQVYLKNIKEDSFIQVQWENLKTKKSIEDSNFDNEDDQIFYKKSSNPEENSFFCALDPTRADTLPHQLNNNSPTGNNNMRLIEMEIEKNKLIQKISELKNHQMHIRSVILNLLKVLDLSPNLKPQSEGIMEIIFDFFEYSQDEKASIFKQKKKKFWGII